MQSLPGVRVLGLLHHYIDRLQDIDDVVDAASLNAELRGGFVERDELLLAGAVQVQKVLAEQTEAAKCGCVLGCLVSLVGSTSVFEGDDRMGFPPRVGNFNFVLNAF